MKKKTSYAIIEISKDILGKDITDMIKSFGAYKRVFMLGIDGMGAFCKNAETPVMDELFKNGATTHVALASRPTISAECWTSMLTGARPEVHKLTNADMHPIEGLPTLFGYIREAFPDAETAAFTDWSPIAFNIISPTGGANKLDGGHDDELVGRLENYLDEKDPKFLFVQFDSVDGAGHTYGYGTQEHLNRISHCDGLLGRIIAKYKQYDRMEDTLFIVTADHGGTPKHSHGGWTDGEKLVFLGVSGKTVMPGQIGEVCMRDFPAIVLHAFGIKAPEFDPDGFASQMPVGIFEDAGIKDRVKLYPPVKTFQSFPEKKKGEKGYITDYVPADQIMFRLGFEEEEESYNDPDGGKPFTVESGRLKRYSNGVRGFCGELGYGTFKLSNLTHSDKFSFSQWFLSNDNYCDELLILDSYEPGKPFFQLWVKNAHMALLFFDENRKYIDELAIQELKETSSGQTWKHFLFTVDLSENTFTAVLNFEESTKVTKKFKADLRKFFVFDSLIVGENTLERRIYRMLDDIMMIDGDFDMAKLEEYYNAN